MTTQYGDALFGGEQQPPSDPWEDDVLPFTPLGAPRVSAASDQPPIVILPGFGNNTADYVAPFGEESRSISAALQARGFRVYVVDVLRKDWIKVARALMSRRYWTKSCTTDPGYTWYLDKVASTVEIALKDSGALQVDLVGHSAGGWLARAFVGDAKYFVSSGGEANPQVRRIVTLGAPHSPPPDPSKDVTAGALAWIHQQYPHSWLRENGLRCTCVGGRAVRGNPESEKGTLGRYAFGSYGMVCGDGNGTEGDCVVPLQATFIEGCEQQVLNGVFHSMSKIGTYSEPALRPWYGSEEVVDAWLPSLVASGIQE